MARRVYFAFHFENDIFRVNQVRNSNVVAGPDRAGFYDHSEYEEAKRKGDEEIKRLIRDKLNNTTVTVVLIGTETASRPYVKYEIEQSIQRNNGLLGVYIHHLKSPPDNRVSPRGPKPAIPQGVEFPSYDWDGDLSRFAREIEAAGKRSDALRGAGSPPPKKETGFGFASLAAAIAGAVAALYLATNVQNQRISNQTVYLDGHTYTNCAFGGCVLVTNTGDFRMRSCTIYGCSVQSMPGAQYGPNGSRITRLWNAVNPVWPGYTTEMNPDGTITID